MGNGIYRDRPELSRPFMYDDDIIDVPESELVGRASFREVRLEKVAENYVGHEGCSRIHFELLFLGEGVTQP